MTANKYQIGEGFRLQAVFEVSDINTDPTTVTFKIKNPSNVITTYVYGVALEVIKDAVGIYHMDITVSAEGNWWYRVEGTGACIAAYENPFVGIASQFY